MNCNDSLAKGDYEKLMLNEIRSAVALDYFSFL